MVFVSVIVSLVLSCRWDVHEIQSFHYSRLLWVFSSPYCTDSPWLWLVGGSEEATAWGSIQFVDSWWIIFTQRPTPRKRFLLIPKCGVAGYFMNLLSWHSFKQGAVPIGHVGASRKRPPVLTLVKTSLTLVNRDSELRLSIDVHRETNSRSQSRRNRFGRKDPNATL